MCVTDRHDMTLAVKVALNPNKTNQPDAVVKQANFVDNKQFQGCKNMGQCFVKV